MKNIPPSIVYPILLFVAFVIGGSLFLTGGAQHDADIAPPQKVSIDHDADISLPQSASVVGHQCQSLPYEDSRDNCYRDYAVLEKNADLCLGVTRSIKRTECIGTIRQNMTPLVPNLQGLSVYPSAVEAGTSAPVFFSVRQTGSEEMGVIELRQVDREGALIRNTGVLRDDGSNGDMTAGDLLYSGTFEINTPEEGAQYFLVEGAYASGAKGASASRALLFVTRFPVDQSGVVSSGKSVRDAVSQTDVSADTILVTASTEVTSDSMEQSIRAVSGKVVGVLCFNEETVVYTIHIPAVRSYAELMQVIARVKRDGSTLDVAPNGIAKIESF